MTPEDRRTYDREWYAANKQRITERRLRKARERRTGIIRQVMHYLLANPCIDCGEPDPVVLQFDHRDDVEKVTEVGTALQRGWSWTRILSEIDKCDVRCANCHQRRTAKQFGWNKIILASMV